MPSDLTDSIYTNTVTVTTHDGGVEHYVLKRMYDDLAERVEKALSELREIQETHRPDWVSPEAEAAGKEPWACGVCGAADGSWPCTTRMEADAAVAALTGEDDE